MMIDILSNNGELEIIDCSRLAYNGISPVTFGDIEVTESGEMKPKETVLTDPEDLMTC
jgi:hypothetical protein